VNVTIIICPCKKDAPTTVPIHVKCQIGHSVKERDPTRTKNKCWKLGGRKDQTEKRINMEEADMKAGK
jgi:hypothetical protein